MISAASKLTAFRVTQRNTGSPEARRDRPAKRGDGMSNEWYSRPVLFVTDVDRSIDFYVKQLDPTVALSSAQASCIYPRIETLLLLALTEGVEIIVSTVVLVGRF
jgi:hypothetical protein